METAAETGRNPVSKHQIPPEYGGEQASTAEPVSRDQILRRERGQESTHFSCSADYESRIDAILLTRLILDLANM